MIAEIEPTRDTLRAADLLAFANSGTIYGSWLAPLGEIW
jgi:hypothetical protein